MYGYQNLGLENLSPIWESHLERWSLGNPSLFDHHFSVYDMRPHGFDFEETNPGSNRPHCLNSRSMSSGQIDSISEWANSSPGLSRCYDCLYLGGRLVWYLNRPTQLQDCMLISLLLETAGFHICTGLSAC